jgi:hypothetical protein
MTDKTTAERTRRYRRRQNEGLYVAHVEIPYSLAHVMIQSGYLTEEQLEDDAWKRGLALLMLARDLLKKRCA